MPSATITSLYRRYRNEGWNASQSLRAARIKAKFEALEDAGYVRLAVEPDDSADLSFLDQDDCYPRSVADRERARASRDGTWGLVGMYRLDPPRDDADSLARTMGCDDGGWQPGGSVWGFIGDDVDPRDNPYAPDIMAETIAAFNSARKASLRERADRAAGRCPACHGTGRVA
jgi:hypothetical protein